VISTRLEEKPLAYQIALFQAADVIIGQHGAALANLIWARKGIDVVEIVPQDLEADVKDYFGSLARCLGQRYHPIQQFHRHGEVNIGEILCVLDEILS
jgi:capsular polysaccharide biosynthesis protein